MCNGSDVCFNTNGSCPGICADGYSGEKCTNSEHILVIFCEMLVILESNKICIMDNIHRNNALTQ